MASKFYQAETEQVFDLVESNEEGLSSKGERFPARAPCVPVVSPPSMTGCIHAQPRYSLPPRALGRTVASVG